MTLKSSNQRTQTIFCSLKQQITTGHLCDILFYNENGTVWAHSCILAGFSSFFSQLFSLNLENSCNWSLKQPMKISVKSIIKCKSDSQNNCIQCLGEIVTFIYTGHIKPKLPHLQHLFVFSERLKNNDLYDICESFRSQHSLLKVNTPLPSDTDNSIIVKSNNISCKKAATKIVESNNTGPTYAGDELTNSTKSPLLLTTSGVESSKSPCKVCSFISDDLSMIKLHQTVFHSQRHKCIYCGCSFKNIPEIVEHIKSSQCNNESNAICSICLFKGKMHSELLSHVTIHEDCKPFKCSYCRRSFGRRSLWLIHTKSHIVQKQVLCSECSLKFCSEAECEKHHKLAHGPKKEICHECGFSTAFAYLLKKHKLKHRKVTLSCKEEGCVFRTSSEIMLTRHRSVHNKSQKSIVKDNECPMCNIRFTLNKNLIRHMKVHRPHEKLNCGFCHYETFRLDKYNEHLENKHHNDVSPNMPTHSPGAQKEVLSNNKLKMSGPKKDICLKPVRDGYNVDTPFSKEHNTLLMNDEGDISIVNTSQNNSVALTLRNIGNLTGSITLDEKTGVLTMNNINSGSVFLNEITGELTYVNLENDKNRELNYFNSETVKAVENVISPQIKPQIFSPEETKLDEFTGEIIKVQPNDEENVIQEQEFDSFDMDINEDSLDGFDEFDEILFDVFNDMDFKQVALQEDTSVGDNSTIMPHLDESTGLLTFDQNQSVIRRDKWSEQFVRHIDENAPLNDNEAYQLLLDEVTGVLHN